MTDSSSGAWFDSRLIREACDAALSAVTGARYSFRIKVKSQLRRGWFSRARSDARVDELYDTHSAWRESDVNYSTERTAVLLKTMTGRTSTMFVSVSDFIHIERYYRE